MSISLMSDNKQCLVCGRTDNLHRHHIFYGRANRKLSEKYGCWCWLCAEHHNMSTQGIHFNKILDVQVKQLCQREWEEIYGTREDFRAVFGKSYL